MVAQEPASLPKKTLSHTSPVHPAIQISDCSSDATYYAEQEIAELFLPFAYGLTRTFSLIAS